MAGTRSDTFAVHLSIDNEDWGIWDKKTGGQLDSTEVKYKPGAMAQTISLGGTVTPDNITLSRNYRKERDHDRVQQLYDKVAKGNCVIKQTPMDPDGNIYGKPIVWRGTLKRVFAPDVDSETSTAAMIELEITTDGSPTS